MRLSILFPPSLLKKVPSVATHQPWGQANASLVALGFVPLPNIPDVVETLAGPIDFPTVGWYHPEGIIVTATASHEQKIVGIEVMFMLDVGWSGKEPVRFREAPGLEMVQPDGTSLFLKEETLQAPRPWR